MRLLVVCTANQCRSPMAAALLARRLAGADVSAEVGSVGVRADGRRRRRPKRSRSWPSAASTSPGIKAAASRFVTWALLTSLFGMAREYVREAVVLDPTAWSRAFTLKELVHRARPMGALGRT